MSNMMDAAFAWQKTQLAAAAGVSATYQQGTTTVTVTVVPEGSGKDKEYLMPLADTPEATSFAIHQADQGYCSFLVPVAELAAAGIVKPAQGDKIIIGGKEYPMTAPDGMEPWMPIGVMPDGTNATWYRVHTKLSA